MTLKSEISFVLNLSGVSELKTEYEYDWELNLVNTSVQRSLHKTPDDTLS